MSPLLFEGSWRPTHRVVLYQADTKAVHAMMVMSQSNGLAFTRHQWISQSRPMAIAQPNGTWTLDESVQQEYGISVRLLKVEMIADARAWPMRAA